VGKKKKEGGKLGLEHTHGTRDAANFVIECIEDHGFDPLPPELADSAIRAEFRRQHAQIYKRVTNSLSLEFSYEYAGTAGKLQVCIYRVKKE